jgi:hypothetical protein
MGYPSIIKHSVFSGPVQQKPPKEIAAKIDLDQTFEGFVCFGVDVYFCEPTITAWRQSPRT